MENKLQELINLNKKIKTPPFITAFIMAVVSAFLFGLGLTMILEWNIVVWGVIVGVVGILIMLVTYPIYQAILQIRQQKYADNILSIAKELLGEE